MLCGLGLCRTPTVSIARRRPARAVSGAARPTHCRPLHHERHRPEQTALYRMVQQHAASFIAHTEACTGAALPRFVKAEPGLSRCRSALTEGTSSL